MCHLTSFNDDINIHTTIIFRNRSTINYEGTIHVYICMHSCHFIQHIDFYWLSHPSHICYKINNCEVPSKILLWTCSFFVVLDLNMIDHNILYVGNYFCLQNVSAINLMITIKNYLVIVLLTCKNLVWERKLSVTKIIIYLADYDNVIYSTTTDSLLLAYSIARL